MSKNIDLFEQNKPKHSKIYLKNLNKIDYFEYKQKYPKEQLN